MNPLSIPDHVHWELKELRAGEIHEIAGNQILTVIAGGMHDRVKGRLTTFESSAFYRGTIQVKEDTLLSIFTIADPNIILNKINVEEIFGQYCRDNWTKLSDLPGCEALSQTDLYRGDQVEHEFEGTNYKFNLWFCGANVDCLWHNQHDFIETHTNLAGDGFMQKSSDGTDLGLEETYGLMPGNSHRKFNIPGQTEENGNPKYPMHRWLGGNTGNVWFVIEKY